MPNENTDPRPSNQVAAPAMTVSIGRLPRARSLNQDTMGSSMPIAVVNAAKNSNRKNSEPMYWPPGILPKATGSVMNIRLGPSPGLSPLAKTIGNMARPASTAINVSPRQITSADCCNEKVCGMYAP